MRLCCYWERQQPNHTEQQASSNCLGKLHAMENPEDKPHRCGLPHKPSMDREWQRIHGRHQRLNRAPQYTNNLRLSQSFLIFRQLPHSRRKGGENEFSQFFNAFPRAFRPVRPPPIAAKRLHGRWRFCGLFHLQRRSVGSLTRRCLAVATS